MQHVYYYYMKHGVLLESKPLMEIWEMDYSVPRTLRVPTAIEDYALGYFPRVCVVMRSW